MGGKTRGLLNRRCRFVPSRAPCVPFGPNVVAAWKRSSLQIWSDGEEKIFSQFTGEGGDKKKKKEDK